MNSMTFIRKIDEIGEERDRTRLFDCLSAIWGFAAGSSNLPDPRFPHRSLILAKEDLHLDYALKRFLMGATVDDQAKQRNYLQAALLFIKFFAEKIDIEKLVHFIFQSFAVKNTVNKTEKYFFNFAKLNLLFAVLELLENGFLADADKLENSIVLNIQLTVKNEPFARLFLSGILENTPVLTKAHFLCLKAILSGLSISNYQDADFALTLKQALAEKVDSGEKGVSKKGLAALQTQVNNFIKELYDPKTLLKLFENINKDENLKSGDNSLRFYGKLARLMLGHADTKLSTLISLGKIIAGAKDKKNEGFAFVNKLHQLILLTDKIFELCQSLDHFLHLVISKNLVEDFQALLVLIFEQKQSRNKNVAIAFSGLEKTLISRFRENEKLPDDFVRDPKKILAEKSTEKNDDSRNFAQFLLKFFYEYESLSRIHFGLKDHLLKRESNQASVGGLLESSKAKIDASLSDGAYNLFKLHLTNYCSLFTPISDPKIAIKGFKHLFLLYKRVPQFVLNFKEELNQRSSEFLTTALYNFIFQKIAHAVFKGNHQPLLGQLAGAWMKLNGAEDEFSSLELADELINRDGEKSRSLAILNLVLLLQNYKSEDRDIESLIFGQSIEDVAIFSQKILMSESEVEAADMEILTDVLISLMNTPSNDIRRIINGTLNAFAEHLDENCLELIENAIFKEQGEGDNEENGEEEEEDVEIGGEDMDEELEENEEDGELEEEDDEIVIEGKLF